MRKTFTATLAALMLLATAAFAGGGYGWECDGPHGGHGPKAGWNDGGHRGCGPGDRMGPGMRGHRGLGGGLLGWADELELTDQQQEQLKKLQHDFQMARIDREAEMKKAAANARMLMHDDNAAKDDVLKAIDKVSSLRAEMKKQQYLHHQDVKNVLTSEQIDKLKELRPRSDVKPNRDAKGRRGFGR